jgi:hypothetical protein
MTGLSFEGLDMAAENRLSQGRGAVLFAAPQLRA